MNSASTIEISKSSVNRIVVNSLFKLTFKNNLQLLSLKAEIFRKQQEVKQAKYSTKLQPTPLRQKTVKENERRNKGVDDRRTEDDKETESMLEKSRKMLEAKTVLYNRLTKGPKDLSREEIERNQHYLVQFDRKEKPETEDEESEDEHEYEPASNADEEWVEYVDCLGRTRTCLRKELTHLKEKDYELSKTIGPDGKQVKEEELKWAIDTEVKRNTEETKDELIDKKINENSEMLSSDMRRELMRKEWEKQEQELMNKRDVHYQDVLFNEARSHGVGYYSFSQDDEVRAKQQEELRKLRQETTQQQISSSEQKALRERQLAARLKAARNRKLAREGLPPEEDDPDIVLPPQPVLDNKFVLELQTKKEAEERVKEEKRRKQIRPWDIGKQGLTKKQHYECSQEEWVSKKRTERLQEFAPPSTFRGERPSISIEEPNKSLFFTSKRMGNSEMISIDTSVPPPHFINPYKNYRNEDAFIATPIVDEYVDFDDEQLKGQESKCKRKRAEVAPPSKFDYYGPSSTKTVRSKVRDDLEDSIAAGLKFLRQQAEKKEKSTTRREFE